MSPSASGWVCVAFVWRGGLRCQGGCLGCFGRGCGSAADLEGFVDRQHRAFSRSRARAAAVFLRPSPRPSCGGSWMPMGRTSPALPGALSQAAGLPQRPSPADAGGPPNATADAGQGRAGAPGPPRERRGHLLPSARDRPAPPDAPQHPPPAAARSTTTAKADPTTWMDGIGRTGEFSMRNEDLDATAKTRTF